MADENGNATDAVMMHADLGPVKAASGKYLGAVKWFNSTKGFGFVTPNDASMGDIFVHQSSIHADGFRSLGEGEVVEFNVETDPEGKTKAVEVTAQGGGYVQGAPKRENRRRRERRSAAAAAGAAAEAAGEGGEGGARNFTRKSRGKKAGGGEEGEEGEGESSGLQVVVHNLSWDTDWKALKEAFAVVGSVARADIASDHNGRSRGFGTVRYDSTEEAEAAINQLHNTEMDGRVITVRLDRFA